MKFLIIRFSSIGDIVLTTPVIRCLKQQVPGASVHFLTKKVFGPLLEHNPYVDKLHFLQDDFRSMAESLRAENYDAVIDLHRNIRSLRVRRALGVRSHAFQKLNVEKWLVTNFKWNTLPDIHIVDRYLNTVASYGVRNDGLGLDYSLPDDTRPPSSILPARMQLGYVALVAGAAHATKRIPVEKMKEICRLIPHPVVLLGGKEDALRAAEVTETDPARIFNACGMTSLHESAALVKEARVVVSADTGLMHIAAAMRKPLVVLWGNTIPGFGMYPYYGVDKVPFRNLEVNGLRCRPCSKIGYEACPRKHFRCMAGQSAETVASTITAYWSGLPGDR